MIAQANRALRMRFYGKGTSHASQTQEDAQDRGTVTMIDSPLRYRHQ